MKITVIAKPRSKVEKVVEHDDGSYTVAVHSAPTDGKANEAIIRLLAKHLNIAPSQCEIVSGFSGKRKIIRI